MEGSEGRSAFPSFHRRIGLGRPTHERVVRKYEQEEHGSGRVPEG